MLVLILLPSAAAWLFFRLSGRRSGAPPIRSLAECLAAGSLSGLIFHGYDLWQVQIGLSTLAEALDWAVQSVIIPVLFQIAALLAFAGLRGRVGAGLAIAVAALAATLVLNLAIYPIYFKESPGEILTFVEEEWFWWSLAAEFSAAAVLLAIAFRPAHWRIGPDNRTKEIAAVAFGNSPNEPLRLLAGLAATGRLPDAHALKHEVRHPCQAAPFPVDVDRDAIWRIVQGRQQQETVRSWYYALITVTAVALTMASESPLPAILALLVAGGISYRNYRRDRYVIAPAFADQFFDAAPGDDGADSTRNVVVYRGNWPFANFGYQFGSWTLSVDIERPSRDKTSGSGLVEPPDLRRIESQIETNLSRSGLLGSHVRELFLAQGKNLPREIKSPGPFPPVSILAGEAAQAARDGKYPAVRRYLWLRRAIWNAEVSISYFVRLEKAKGDLNLEMVGVVMPPIAEKHRFVDRIPPQSFNQTLGDLFYSLGGGAVMLVVGPIVALSHIQETISESVTDPQKAIIQEVRRTPAFDFGAPESLRRKLSDLNALSYFQGIDRRMAEAAFTGRIMRVFIDALDACNIDTTELREQRTTLLNQGIIVQGGDLRAQNVASGAGARITGMGSGKAAEKGAS